MKLSKNLCVIDVETTGPSPFVHDLLSVAFVPVMMPERALSVFVRHSSLEWTDFGRENFKKFDHDWNQHAVAPSDACHRIESYLELLFQGEPATLIGHNVGFDVSFLRKLALSIGKFQLSGISHRSIDTHTMLYVAATQGAIPFDATSSEAAFEFLGIMPPLHLRHTALGDAIATRAMFLRLLDVFESDTSRQLRRAR